MKDNVPLDRLVSSEVVMHMQMMKIGMESIVFAGVYLPLIASAKMCKSVFEDSEDHPSIARRLAGVQRGLKKILAPDGWENTENYRFLLMRLVQFPM